jgi:hypothetical protein
VEFDDDATPADPARADAIRIDGVVFNSKRLHSALAQAGAHSAILVAVGAGPETEEEARRCWSEERPDEYFFLEVFASAVVEHLTTIAGARLCDWAEQRGMTVLPHSSPGYPDWDVAEQPRLLELIKKTRCEQFPSRLDVFDSGMLRPKKAQLAVFGVTRHTERLQASSAANRRTTAGTNQDIGFQCAIRRESEGLATLVRGAACDAAEPRRIDRRYVPL